MIVFPWLEPLIKWAKDYAKPYNVWFYWSGVLICGVLGAISVEVWVKSGFQEAKNVLIVTGIVWLMWLTIGQAGRILNRRSGR